MGPRDKKWIAEHPVALSAPEPFGSSYRLLPTSTLLAMLPFQRGEDGSTPERRGAILAHLAIRGVKPNV